MQGSENDDQEAGMDDKMARVKFVVDQFKQS
jgi:hypothetical protein